MPLRSNVCTSFGVLVLCLALTSCTGAGAGVLTVAGSGVASSIVLDKLEAKVAQIVQQAAAAGSLVSTKAARDLQLEISAARQQLHDELDHNWDRLDQEKISGLREIDSAVDELNHNIAKGGSIVDDLTLDVDTKMNRIPFLRSAHTIRRVDGASQYFRTEGLYTVRIKGNLFEQDAGKPVVYIGDCDANSPRATDRCVILPESSVQLTPPYEVVLQIPVEVINNSNFFTDRFLGYIPMLIRQNVPNRDYFFQAWKDKFRSASFRTSIELFPRFPATYSLTEFSTEPFVDTEKTEVAPARFMYVPGCGNEGCNAYYNPCTDVPPGGQPLQAVDFQDSFSGWGGFGAQTHTSTGICTAYWQHSHNVGRNVGFNVQYHPLSSHVVHHELDLQAMSPDKMDVFSRKSASTSQATGSPLMSFGTILQAVTGPLVAVTPSAAQNATTPPLSGNPVVPVKLLMVDHGAVRLGRSYSVQFSPTMVDFHLVFRTFTGEELIVTPGKKSALIDASPVINQTNYKAMTVSLKAPW